MIDSTHHITPVIAGTAVAVASGAYSFFGTTLVIVQWFAAAVAALAGLMTIAYTIKHWHKGKPS